MKHHRIYLILLYISIISCITTFSFSQSNNAITYKISGRLGDFILTYVKAKWVSFKYNIPLLYKPFLHRDTTQSDMFAMHLLEKQYAQSSKQKFRHTVPIKSEADVADYTEDNTLFMSDLYLKTIPHGETNIYNFTRQYPEFGNEIKKMLQPIIPLPKLDLPTDKTTVALHIRKGSRLDPPLFFAQPNKQKRLLSSKKRLLKKHKPILYADKKWPLVFPPDQYYIDQIKKLSVMLDDAPLFIHIFTDYQNPKELAKRFKKAISKPNITFSYRKKSNNYQDHVLEDFYNMAQFDCLIRSGSHFAWATQLIGNFKVIMYPQSAHWVNDTLIIDKVNIISSLPNTKSLSS